jgi:hypothetical protein
LPPPLSKRLIPPSAPRRAGVGEHMKRFDHTSRQRLRPFAALALATTLTACLPAPEGQEAAALPGVVMARSIPVAHTPPGGLWQDVPGAGLGELH